MIVHNISDRPNTASLPTAICVGNTLIRPGKFAEIPEGDISEKVRKLHGSHLWIGRTLPPKFTSTSKSALRNLQVTTTPMTQDEALAYLRTLEKEDLLGLCQQISPPLVFNKSPGPQMLAILLSRAIFQDGVQVNPESFFWLRRWAKRGTDFEERD